MAKESIMKIKGKSLWAKLRTVDEYQGNPIGYTIQVVVSKAEADRVLSYLEAVLEEAKNSKEFAGKQWSTDPMMGYSVKDGKHIFKMKMKHEFVSKKTGETVKRAVPVFDKHGSPLDQDIEVGNDSDVVVAFTPIPFHTSKVVNGISLRLDAVQVTNLIPRGNFGGADYFGFDIAEGE